MAAVAGDHLQQTSSSIKVGAKSIVCNDADLKGDITFGPGCIVHPKASIHALAGPIVLGDGCIIEETAVILNRSSETMTIGSHNLFEVGCRVEALRIGSFNTFEARSRVPSSISLEDWCVVGAGCTVYPDETMYKDEDAAAGELLPSFTVVYGVNNARRLWSGEGKEQQRALLVKHLSYLTETLPRYNKLKLIT